MRYTGPIRSDERAPRPCGGRGASANPIERTRHSRMAAEFEAVARPELGLEPLLRLTLEFVLRHVGPTNAAIFLPGDPGHVVGGYINHTLDRDAADLLLDHLAVAAAPHIAEADGPLHATRDEQIRHWLAEGAGPLRGCHVLALPCRHDDEPLASIMLFRDAADPFEPGLGEILNRITSLFAAQLVRVIHVHHRHQPDLTGDGDQDDGGIGVFQP